MSTSSSEEGSVMLPLHHDGTRASGLDSMSTSSLLFSVPSDFETDITPPSSATSSFSSEAKRRITSATPRDVFDASRRLGQLALQDDANAIQTPTKVRHPGWLQHHRSPCVAGDETGYEADGDVDNDVDGDGEDGNRDKATRAGAGASMTTTTKPNRRPTFLRIDTRQQRRVASMLATTTRRSSTSPGFPFGDTDTDSDMDVEVKRESRTRRASYDMSRKGYDKARTSNAAMHPLRVKLAPLTSIRIRASGTSTNPVKTGKVESYELRRRPGRSPNRGAREPVGLGIGFPENHPLRSRAFTLPVIPAVVQEHAGPGAGDEEALGDASTHECGSEYLSYPRSAKWRRIDVGDETATVQSDTGMNTTVTLCAPNAVRLQVPVALRPAYPKVSPSPIDWLPTRNGQAREAHWGLSASQSDSIGLTVRRVRVGPRKI